MRPIFVLLAFVSFLIEPAAAAPRRKGAAPVSVGNSGVELTRLRAGTPAVLTASTRRGREVKHVNVEVHNVGQAPARGVEVWAEFGAGLAYPLRGPRSLDVGRRGLYVLRGGVPLVSTVGCRIVSTCQTCRR